MDWVDVGNGRRVRRSQADFFEVVDNEAAERDMRRAIRRDEARVRERDRLAEVQREAARKRRARLAGVPHEPYTRQEVFLRDRGRCYICGVELKGMWHVDHVMPIVAGGADTLDNVRAACAPCNLAKGARF
jgi:5-methylcytosine-specific restriction endonuclease McrA